MHRRHLVLVAAVFAWWTLEGLTTAGQLLTMQGPDALTPWQAIRRGVLSAWLWVPCSLFLLWAVVRAPIERGRAGRSIAVLTVAALLVVLFRAAAIQLANPWLGWYPTPPRFGDVLLTSVLNNFLLAWLNIGVGHALLFARRAYERQRQAEQLEARLADTRLAALRAQLDPHFLFNALNSIAETIHLDPAAADRMLVGLGELLRSSLDRRDLREVPLEEELRLLHHYLQIEQARLGARLRVHWEIAPGLDDVSVPPLLLQPLAENAIRHAIAAKIAPGCIEVLAWRDDNNVWLAIRDDGAVHATHAQEAIGQGVGLSNIVARLELLYGGDHAFALVRRAEGGTEARVRLPLRRAARARAAA